MVETAKQRLMDRRTDPRPAKAERTAESRLDPLTGNWTIFSPQRLARPEEFHEFDQPDRVSENLPESFSEPFSGTFAKNLSGRSAQQRYPSQAKLDCPFCPGNEEQTPSPVWVGQISAEDSSVDVIDTSGSLASPGDWSVRVIPNKFPAVDPIDPPSDGMRGTGLFQRRPISGGHEVIVESRQHVQSLTDLDLTELNLVFAAYRDRIRHWRGRPGVSYISAFKNVGGKAGASLRHTHSQLIATDRMPTAVAATVERMTRYRAATGCCLSCELIRGELKSRKRVVWRDESLVAFCPFASSLPMLIRLTTRNHEGCFEDLDASSIESVSRLVHRVISWLERVRPGTAYNFCLHTRPPAIADVHDAFHWWIDIFPRMTQVAGFEWSSHCMINPVLPEDAAAKLRECARSEDPRTQL